MLRRPVRSAATAAASAASAARLAVSSSSTGRARIQAQQPAILRTLRHLSSATSPSRAVPTQPSPLFSSSHVDVEKDNLALRSLFDNPTSADASSSSAALAPTGLFQIPNLNSPQDFISLAQQTLARAQLLVDRIVRADQHATTEELTKVVRNLDRLSDLLCGVIDMAELVRNAHPDPYWAEAANAAYEYLCGYMNVLNTHTGLYRVLKRLLSTPEIVSSLSEEAVAVAYVFLRDFEKSGIHLPPAQRERFVQLSDEILVLGRGFLQDIAGNAAGEYSMQDSDASTSASGNQGQGQDQFVDFPNDWLKDMNPSLVTALRSNCLEEKNGMLRFSLVEHPWAFQTILKHAPDERARKVAFVAANSGSKQQIQRLERLLKARAELAVLTGASSYAEMSLGDKMAKRPENVEEFLRALTNHHRPRAAKDLDKLRLLKHNHKLTAGRSKTFNPNPTLPEFGAWDRDIYTEQHFRSPALRSVQPLSPYFSLGTVFAGLSRLFSRLYGIRFRAAEVAPGEVWSEGRGDVMKVEVLDEREGARAGDGASEGLVGTIYADLWSREGKPGGAAHYTVRCSRRVDLDDEAGDFAHGRAPDGSVVSPADLGASGTSNPLRVPTFAQRDREGRYQQPIVVLMCDFSRPTALSSGPCLLAWHEVETLFHEMGHAIHSMIGRTAYHNVSGTRCATDFVELPSILMEHFVASPQLIRLMARHYATDAHLPYEHLRTHLAAGKSLEGLDTYHQIMLARLDQTYHSSAAADASFDSTRAYEQLDADMAIAATAPGASPQTRFGHLFGYGATYYSYLLDRAIASRVWKSLFDADPLDRDAGERFKHVLRFGGGKDPWHLLADLLGDESLRAGGREAMRQVGRWGIEHDVATQSEASSASNSSRPKYEARL